jgi:putative ABC transport system ATP-binding protein
MSLLRLCSVTKSYRRGVAGVIVLRDVSLTVAPGSLVSIYGDRASGKTTLLRVAAGLEPPDGGEVLLDGARTDVGWLLRQGPNLDRLTVIEHVALPLYREAGTRVARDRARAALRAVGADEHADALWSELSDVARSLCAIAHATARRRRLLIADDPTAGLGVADRERVCAALRSVVEDGMAVLSAGPDLSATLHAHEQRVLSNGRLLAAGDGSAAGWSVPEPEQLPLRPRRSA